MELNFSTSFLGCKSLCDDLMFFLFLLNFVGRVFFSLRYVLALSLNCIAILLLFLGNSPSFFDHPCVFFVTLLILGLYWFLTNLIHLSPSFYFGRYHVFFLWVEILVIMMDLYASQFCHARPPSVQFLSYLKSTQKHRSCSCVPIIPTGP